MWPPSVFTEGACVERCLCLKQISQALDIPMSLYEELAGEEENLESAFVKGTPSKVLLEAGENFLRRTTPKIKVGKECTETSSLTRVVEEIGPLSLHPVRNNQWTAQEGSNMKAIKMNDSKVALRV